MKKILCLILIFTLLFCVSCNVADSGDILSEPPSESTPSTPEISPSEESSSNLEESLQPEESNNVPPEDSSDKTEEPEGASGQGEIDTPTFEKYDEYLKFIDSVKNLPDDFITYDMLKDIGEFRSFVCDVKFEGYNYSFIDKNGIRIDVNIQPLPNKIKTYPLASPYDSSNLQRGNAPIELWSTYSHNIVTYYYYSGELHRMEWAMETKLVTLSCSGQSNTLADYPLEGETTFVSQLLSLQTAEAAVEAFNQKVEAAIAKNIADKQSKG